MIVREIEVKSILTKTKIPGHDYCLNPYSGCAHGCRYCYAGFMRRFSGHEEHWGSYVDVKVNAVEMLRRQLKRPKTGSVCLSSVTDPYQALEEKYRLTRGCLELLKESGLSVSILTRSPLAARDIDLFQEFRDIEVGFSIGTDDDKIRALLEPCAPTIPQRIEALRKIHDAGITTYVFIGPLLPLDAKKLAHLLKDAVDSVLIDRMNYSSQIAGVYKRANLSRFLDDCYFEQTEQELRTMLTAWGKQVITCF